MLRSPLTIDAVKLLPIIGLYSFGAIGGTLHWLQPFDYEIQVLVIDPIFALILFPIDGSWGFAENLLFSAAFTISMLILIDLLSVVFLGSLNPSFVAYFLTAFVFLILAIEMISHRRRSPETDGDDTI